MAGLSRLQAVLYQQLSCGAVLSLAGIAFFLMGAFGILANATTISSTCLPYASAMVSVFFRAAGCFVGSGWFVERYEAGDWPFRGALKRREPRCGWLARAAAILCLTTMALILMLRIAEVQ